MYSFLRFPPSFADKVFSLYPSELGPTSLLRTSGFTVKTASCCTASKAVTCKLTMTDQTARVHRPSVYTDEDDECPELSNGDSGFDYN